MLYIHTYLGSVPHAPGCCCLCLLFVDVVVGPCNVLSLIEQEAELAWHFFLPGLTSGYMYYGNAGDMPVKQTVACNLAIKHASASIAK